MITVDSTEHQSGVGHESGCTQGEGDGWLVVPALHVDIKIGKKHPMVLRSSTHPHTVLRTQHTAHARVQTTSTHAGSVRTQGHAVLGSTDEASVPASLPSTSTCIASARGIGDNCRLAPGAPTSAALAAETGAAGRPRRRPHPAVPSRCRTRTALLGASVARWMGRDTRQPQGTTNSLSACDPEMAHNTDAQRGSLTRSHQATICAARKHKHHRTTTTYRTHLGQHYQHNCHFHHHRLNHRNHRNRQT